MRELDYEVAQRVMGFTAAEVDAERWCEQGSVTDCARKVRDVPEYSADIAAAWIVVEQVLFHGAYCHDEQRNGMTDFRLEFNPYARTFEARFSWSSSFAVSGHGKEPPEAICRAALAAVKEGEA